MMPMYNPTLTLINDLLKTHIRLIENFVYMSRSVSRSSDEASASGFKYTTLQETKSVS